MSRSGYSEDCAHLGLWRANVDRAIAAKQNALNMAQAALDWLRNAVEAESIHCTEKGDATTAQRLRALLAASAERKDGE
jgi:hypothetical protein